MRDAQVEGKGSPADPVDVMARAYQKPGLTISQGGNYEIVQVKSLQRDLRALGYLKSVIDGEFGPKSAQAVRAVQYDLLHNAGKSSAKDGTAPVSVTAYNQGRVPAVDGRVDQSLAACLAEMMSDEEFPKLPSAADSAAENRKALAAIAAAASSVAPTPFILAIVPQESSSQHFRVPKQGDDDDFVVVGLDRNDKANPDRITSRGYGIGQYTIFHHPPTQTEMADFVLDPVRNVERAYRELREKFDGFVIGAAGADDRLAEHPLLPLRLCKYAATDQRFMRDCIACAKAARNMTVKNGDPVYRGAATLMKPTKYYAAADYSDVPDRADFPCDWPYAARRYNGGGVNSYHYQARILRNLLGLAAS